MVKNKVLVYITRSGIIHTWFIDPDNDYLCLGDALESFLYLFKKDYGIIEIPRMIHEDTRYQICKKFFKEHDCGQLELCEAED